MPRDNIVMKEKLYTTIVKHYESCFQKHGDNCLGVGWNNQNDLNKRFEVMLGVIKEDPLSKTELLDLGCGTAMLYEYIQNRRLNNIIYSGLDLSPQYIEVSRKKFPGSKFYLLDILDDDTALPQFDYIVMNGVFTQKRNLAFDQMFEYMKNMVLTVFGKARKGVVFNVMSKEVDWEDEGNFYLSFDQLEEFLKKKVSTDFIFRTDYGLYEYTAYVYKVKYKGK